MIYEIEIYFNTLDEYTDPDIDGFVEFDHESKLKDALFLAQTGSAPLTLERNDHNIGKRKLSIAPELLFKSFIVYKKYKEKPNDKD